MAAGPSAFRTAPRRGRTRRCAGPASALRPPARDSCIRACQGSRPPSSSASCRSEEHTSELQSRSDLVCRLLLEKKKQRSPKRWELCSRSRLPPSNLPPRSRNSAGNRSCITRSQNGAARPPALRACIIPRTSSVGPFTDRKSTRLNSSHDQISYAVFCLKKKKMNKGENRLVLPDKVVHCVVVD